MTPHVRPLVGWLVGWLIGWLVGWLVGWSVCHSFLKGKLYNFNAPIRALVDLKLYSCFKFPDEAAQYACPGCSLPKYCSKEHKQNHFFSLRNHLFKRLPPPNFLISSPYSVGLYSH